MTYPTSIDTFPGTAAQGASLLTSPDHALDHRTLGSAAFALETKVGIGSGTPQSGYILQGTTGGTSQWVPFSLNNQTIGTPAITGGTATNTTFNNGTIGTSLIVGGTFNNGVMGTPEITGGTMNNGVLGTPSVTGGTITSPSIQGLLDGWIVATDTWTYVDANNFKISGVDRTSTFNIGDKIKLTQTTVKYFIVSAVSFSTDTTITVQGGSDYSLANAAITSPYYSKQSTPAAFPSAFTFSPSWAGFSGNPSGGSIKWWTIGRTCFLSFSGVNSGTSNAGTMAITNLPFTSVMGATSLGKMVDNSNGNVYGNADIATSSSRIDFYQTAADGTWGTSGNKGVRDFTIAYSF